MNRAGTSLIPIELFKGGLQLTSVTNGRKQKLPQNLRLSKPTDRTIPWKAIEGILSDDTISFSTQIIFGGKMHFLNFSKKNLKGLQDLVSGRESICCICLGLPGAHITV
jgi:hypothetical protein